MHLTHILLYLLLFSLYRGQEPHIRYEHIYLQDPNSQSEVEYSEMKRPRLDIGTESLIRHSSHRQPLSVGAAEEMAKVSKSNFQIDVNALMQY